MKYTLHQVREDRLREVGFRPFDASRIIHASDYHQTYAGDISNQLQADDLSLLERLWTMFNLARPMDFHGYTMSMADVVMLDDERAYYCDTMGWHLLTESEVEGRFTSPAVVR